MISWLSSGRWVPKFKRTPPLPPPWCRARTEIPPTCSLRLSVVRPPASVRGGGGGRGGEGGGGQEEEVRSIGIALARAGLPLGPNIHEHIPHPRTRCWGNIGGLCAKPRRARRARNVLWGLWGCLMSPCTSTCQVFHDRPPPRIPSPCTQCQTTAGTGLSRSWCQTTAGTGLSRSWCQTTAGTGLSRSWSRSRAGPRRSRSRSRAAQGPQAIPRGVTSRGSPTSPGNRSSKIVDR